MAVMPSIEDPAAYCNAMMLRLAEYPALVLEQAIERAQDQFDFMRSIKAMRAVCEQLMAPQHNRLHVIAAMLDEHARRQAERERRRAEEAEAQAKARQKAAEQQARMEKLFGDAAPTLDESELAGAVTPLFDRAGPTTICMALDKGEPWAPMLCRGLALARRAQLAMQKGVIGAKRAVAIAQLTIADEAQARRQVEEIEAAPVISIAAANDSNRASADFDGAIESILAAADCRPCRHTVPPATTRFAAHDRPQRPLPDLSAELAAFRERLAAASAPSSEAAASAGEG